ncbi:hypothetical protein J7E81_11680 [Bacillus sp. ISL-18]|uniref:hypothetical protein n=1 Tax=Bacillus sp. ISL-18 TaxID=2819118 RepID=UPI001BEC0AFE|nr:hypothetical protein [Bacillus sp. ISL-18]MBT2655884.1 hypothetical protein [Bacillus sp. ISL-18]
MSKVEPTSDKEEPQSTMMSEEIPKNPEPHDFNRGDYKEELLGRDESLWYYKRTMHLKNFQNLYEVCRKINSVTNYRWIINENCIE